MEKDELRNENLQQDEPKAVLESKPEAPKIPVFTAIVLAILCVLSLGTGIYYWYTNYFRTPEEVTPAHVEIQAGTPTIADITVDEASESYYTNDAEEYLYEPETPFMPPRPVLDPRPQFVALWEQFGNQDIVGHLFIEGTDLDIYVVQGEDNYFYTNHDIYGNPSENGWTFLDYEVDIHLDWELNIVIHGYNGSALQQMLHQYFDYEFFLVNPLITFNTQYAEYEWEIFSFYVAPTAFPFAQVYHDFDIWGDMVEMFTLASLYNTRLDVTEYDQVLTLTTPTSTSADLFYVLQARLLRHITS